MRTYDGIVVGSGQNGLANAAYLAKSGRDVLCPDKNDYAGGATVGRCLHREWIRSNRSFVCRLLRPEIDRDLELARYGLRVTPYDGDTRLMENGDYFGHYADSEFLHRESKAAIGRNWNGSSLARRSSTRSPNTAPTSRA